MGPGGRVWVALLAMTASVLTMAACSNGSSGGSIESGDSKGIVNGTVVQDGDPVLKSTVGLLMKMANGTASCTGTLLSDKVVLTAAHCVPEGVQRIAVIFTRDFSQASRSTVRSGLTFVRHPRWDANQENDEEEDAPAPAPAPQKNPVAETTAATPPVAAPTGPAAPPSAPAVPEVDPGRGDIALVLFAGGLPEGFGPAELIPDTVEMNIGDNVIVTGYGVTNGATHEGSGVLRRTVVKILGLASETEVVEDGHDTGVCFGDSGGPSYVERDGHLYLWGVASAVFSLPPRTEANQPGAPLASPDGPPSAAPAPRAPCTDYDLHTDVSTYKPWINEIVARMTANYDRIVAAMTQPPPVAPAAPAAPVPSPAPGGKVPTLQQILLRN